MRKVLEKAGLSFLRAFGAAALTYAVGILAAPNLNSAYVLAVAAVVGSLVAGFRALQEFVPALSFSAYVKPPWGGYVDSFTRAFAGSLLAAFASISVVPDLSFLKNVVVAAVIGALAAGIKAVQGLTTKGEQPAAGSGI